MAFFRPFRECSSKRFRPSLASSHHTGRIIDPSTKETYMTASMRKRITRVSLMASTLAFPLIASASQTWVGSGTAYTPEGVEKGTYRIEVVNTEVGPNEMQSEATITLADGSVRKITQKIT